jgi:hypothetical protein
MQMAQIHSNAVIPYIGDLHSKRVKYYSCSDCHISLLNESDKLELREGLKLCVSISSLILLITLLLLFMLPEEWQVDSKLTKY